MSRPVIGGARFELFDGLRAIAVLCVAYSHWIPAKYNLGFDFGRFGVQLFFVLSGFLITGLLLDAKASAARWGRDAAGRLIANFIVRRMLRIFPVYYVTLLACFVLGVGDVSDDFLWHATYLSNWLFWSRDSWGGASSHFWSLAVEEQFYLIWPLLIALTGRYFASGLTKLMIIACVSAVCIVSVIRPEALPFFLVLPIPAFLALGCGALLAFRASYEHSSIVFPVLARVGLIALFLGAGICVSVLGLSGIWAAFAHIALICGIVLIVELATKGGWGWIGAFLRWRPLAFLGTVSYGFYVFHNFAPTIVNRLIRVGTLPTGSDVGLIAPVLNFSTTLILASLSWMILERPINQLKARFPYVSGTS